MTSLIPHITPSLVESFGDYEALRFDVSFPDDDQLIEYANNTLTQPSNSMWSDDEVYETHGLMFSTPDPQLTDDYAMDYSNYRSVYAEVSKLFPEDVEEATFGHWTYSRFLTIKVRVVDENGAITPAFALLVAIARNLEHNYPVFDEQDYQELCSEIEGEFLDQVARDLDIGVEHIDELIRDDFAEVYGSPNDLVFNVPSFERDPKESYWDEQARLREHLLEYLEGKAAEERDRAHGRVELW